MWFPERGYGWYPADPSGAYGGEYFEKYVGYARTPMGRELTCRRVEFVNSCVGLAEVLDVGIGCGAFIEARGSTLGYDVNPRGVEWLLERSIFLDPYAVMVSNATFWDSLEHIREPERLIDRVLGCVVVSLPIFTSPEHVLRSRHFRRDEHYHYWTEDGLTRWFRGRGFRLVRSATFDSDLGRDGIGTYAFRRS